MRHIGSAVPWGTDITSSANLKIFGLIKIKKFKNALGKYGGTERSISGPEKGIDDSELMALVTAGHLPNCFINQKLLQGDFALQGMELYSPSGIDENKLGLEERNAFCNGLNKLA
ncbi:hypothetical protein Leryth_013096 [Lithospermum erythrorhizon]|nr:hypothetical protein Leryth_013096 [Lithospermum erythrorhizon]